MSESVRSKSRSPLQSRSHSPEETTRCFSPEDKKAHRVRNCNLLHLSNIPKHWKFSNVKDFIRQKNSDVAEAIMYVRMLRGADGSPLGECAVLFTSYQLCTWALSELKGIQYDGRPINIKIDNETSFTPKAVQKRTQNTKTFHPYNNRVDRPHRPAPNHPAQRNTGGLSALSNNPQHYETYGLSTSYLNSLGIEPPILNRIYVGNLDDSIDEAKLREVFSLAGNIVVCIKSKGPSAKIEYDHPVEAVQAISMFHDQPLCNKRLIVNIDKMQLRKRLLPAGLIKIGPGLGENGEPLRGIRWTLELQPYKQLLNEKIDKLKTKGDNETNTSATSNTSYPMNAQNTTVSSPFSQINPFVSGLTNLSANNLVTSLTNLVNPQASNNLQTMQGLSNVQALQSVLQQNQMGDLASQLGVLQQMGQNVMGQNVLGQHPMGQSMIGQNVLGQNTMSYGQNNQSSSDHGMVSQVEPWKVNQAQSVRSEETGYSSMKSASGFGDNRSNYDREYSDGNYQSTPDKEPEHTDKNLMTSSDMLVFSNLPSSVTLSALTTKMREVGELRFADMSGQGRAIVRFQKVEDALRCIKLFDRSKVDGQMIDVNFF